VLLQVCCNSDIFVQFYKFSKRGHKHSIITTYGEDIVNKDTTCFQATVAALVYLTAICDGLTNGYPAILRPQLRANSSSFEVDEEVDSWIGKSIYLLTQVKLPLSGTIYLYSFFKSKVPVLIN
jgi:hypothetical protein